MTMSASASDVTSPSASRTLVQHRSGDPDLAFQVDEQISPPKFDDKYEERAYLKHRLTLAFRIFANQGRKLDMLSQDFCTFYQDHVLYTNFAGLFFATEEGKAIAGCLGNKKSALLGNHGLLTAGPSIEAAVAWFVLLEKLCEIQLAADASAAGTGKPLVHIGHEEAVSTHYAIGKPEGGYFTGLTLFQVVEKEFGESTFLGRGVELL
ncbi:hypothetical protein QQX98_009525 [Neonectria punicea]|uniref:Class II aldolase/adducin N-terminal domain-containing protein n=1 Tax=Neonectria punicea TaxID=979145 RepID=A0ABR1GSF5_9HYPO